MIGGGILKHREERKRWNEQKRSQIALSQVTSLGRATCSSRCNGSTRALCYIREPALKAGGWLSMAPSGLWRDRPGTELLPTSNGHTAQAKNKPCMLSPEELGVFVTIRKKPKPKLCLGWCGLVD